LARARLFRVRPREQDGLEVVGVLV
jgi:hypothetical protein